VSILLSSLSGFVAIFHGHVATYDANVAVLTATLVAVIWYTQFTFEALAFTRQRDNQERQRAKATLATGLLEELSWLEGMLEQTYVDGPYSYYDPFDHPLLASALANSTLFGPDTVASLARFHALLRDVRAGMEQYRSNPNQLLGTPKGPNNARKKEFFWFMQSKAAFAIQAIPAAVNALCTEGGILRQRETTEGHSMPNLPSLPSSPFGLRRLTTPAPSESGKTLP
jgi:hypothetical protein